MNTETASSLTDILTNVSALQTNLMAMPGAGDSMERLYNIRKTALGVLESETPLDGMLEGQRQEALDQADRLAMLIAVNVDIPIPDSTLFRIGAAADTLAGQIRKYADTRNHAAAARIVAKRKQDARREVDRGN